jgi:hypothetical protein
MRWILLLMFVGLLSSFQTNAQDCVIEIPRMEWTPCDSSGTYDLFAITEGANTSDSCLLYVNGAYAGMQAIGGPYLRLGPFAGDGQPVLIVAVDAEDSTCLDSIIFEGLDCGMHGDCMLTEVFAEPYDCDSLGMYDVDLVVRGNHTGDEFFVWVNGVSFGSHTYQSVPVRLGPFPGDGMTPLVFYIQDAADSLCAIDYTRSPVSCDSIQDCQIREVVTEATDCNEDGMYDLHMIVRGENTSDSFLLLINGVSFGTFPYNQNPVVAGPFPGDGQTDLVIFIVDALDSLCSFTRRREAVLCDTIHPCEIGHLVVEPSPCDAEGRFSVLITFDTNEQRQRLYDVFANNRLVGTYALDRLPQTIERIPRRSSDYQLIRVCINDRPDCCVTKEFYLPCCEAEEQTCHLSDPRYRIWCLESGEYFVLLDFDASQVRSDTFTIRGNGVDYGRFAYSDRPVLLGPFEAGNRNLEFVIADPEYNLCRVVLEIHNSDCDNPTRVLDIDGDHVKVYSSEQWVVIDGFAPVGGTLRLVSLSGQLIMNQPMEGPSAALSTGHLPRGIYILQLAQGDSRWSFKIATGK